MFKRYWIITATLGLTLIHTASYAQNEASDGQNGPAIERNISEEEPYGIPVRIIEDPETALARKGSEAVSEENQKLDLLAQQSMAESTEAMNKATQSMNIAAWFSAAFVLIGTGLLYRSLRLAREANAAAQRAVDITRDVGNKQLRAYLHVASVKVDTSEANFVTDIEVHNFGHTPANNAVIWAHTWVAQFPLCCPLPDCDTSNKMDFPPSVMPPGFSYHQPQEHGVPLGSKEKKAIESETAAFYVYGRATYLDHDGNKRFTNFLYYHTGSFKGWTGSVRRYASGNEAN